MAEGNAGAEFQTGLHPVVFVGASSMAALVGLATWMVVRNNDFPPATNARVIIVGGLLVLLSIVPTCVRWARAAFRVSADGFRGQVGWLRPHVLELPWGNVADVDLDQTWLGARLGYGTIRFLTAEQAVDGFAHVAGAAELLAAVRARLDGRPRGRSARPL